MSILDSIPIKKNKHSDIWETSDFGVVLNYSNMRVSDFYANYPLNKNEPSPIIVPVDNRIKLIHSKSFITETLIFNSFTDFVEKYMVHYTRPNKSKFGIIGYGKLSETRVNKIKDQFPNVFFVHETITDIDELKKITKEPYYEYVIYGGSDIKYSYDHIQEFVDICKEHKKKAWITDDLTPTNHSLMVAKIMGFSRVVLYEHLKHTIFYDADYHIDYKPSFKKLPPTKKLKHKLPDHLQNHSAYTVGQDDIIEIVPKGKKPRSGELSTYFGQSITITNSAGCNLLKTPLEIKNDLLMNDYGFAIDTYELDIGELPND